VVEMILRWVQGGKGRSELRPRQLRWSRGAYGSPEMAEVDQRFVRGGWGGFDVVDVSQRWLKLPPDGLGRFEVFLKCLKCV
jgi:hypothetical protein